MTRGALAAILLLIACDAWSGRPLSVEDASGDPLEDVLHDAEVVPGPAIPGRRGEIGAAAAKR